MPANVSYEQAEPAANTQTSTIRRTGLEVLSLAGLIVAAYLTLVQIGAVDPSNSLLAGEATRWILRRSPLVRAVGIPDAAFRVLAYGAEVALAAIRPSSPRKSSHRQVAFGALAVAMALGSAVLVVLQGVWHHWCVLCLTSAGLSFAIAALVVPEALVTLRSQRARRRVVGGRLPGEGQVKEEL